MDDEDDAFEPKASSRRGGSLTAKGKPKTGLISRGAKGKGKSDKYDKEITFRDERKTAPPVASSSKDIPPSRSKRPHSKLDDDDDGEFDVVNEKEATPPPPPPKKPKLPPIKKNKPAPSSINSTGPSTPATRPPLNKTTTGLPQQQTTANGLPLPPIRKPAATANNADFDLRDADVYRQLFNKVCPPVSLSAIRTPLMCRTIARWDNSKLWFESQRERGGTQKRTQSHARCSQS